MLKSLSVLAAFALLGAAVIALPSFAPKVEAAEATALVKTDRLPIKAPVLNCATQVWPNIETACLRTSAEGAKVLEARLVTARR
jgi:hypothetical protein